jgi:hypothetical protein
VDNKSIRVQNISSLPNVIGMREIKGKYRSFDCSSHEKKEKRLNILSILPM